MSNKFNSMKEIRDSFEFNMEDVSSQKFETTRSLFDDFSSAFNTKALAIAAMMGLSGMANADNANVPLSAIQDTFNQSMAMSNSHYDDKLPTYFEDKHTIKTDTTLKNEFWKGSVVTLVVGEKAVDKMENNKYSEQIYLMNQTAGNAIYISEFASFDKPYGDAYYNATSTYKHYFRNDHSSLKDFEEKLRPQNKRYFDDYITYHEMAHASFEQENSRASNNIPLHLSEIQFESHSDVSSLLMVANKYGLKYNEFRDLVLNVAEIRSNYGATIKDTSHNSSLVLVELIHTLDNNRNIYDKMNNEKISAFAAYFVHGVYNQDKKRLSNKLDSVGIPVNIEDFLDGMDKYRTALKSLDAKGESIVTSEVPMKGAKFYADIFEKVYFERYPEKAEAFYEAVFKDDVMKAAAIKVNAFKEIMNHNETEKAVYAVGANKIMKDVSFESYTNAISMFYDSSEIMKVHDKSVLNDLFKGHRNEVNKMVSADPKIKNKL